MTAKIIQILYKYYKAILFFMGIFVVLGVVSSQAIMFQVDVKGLPSEALIGFALDMMASIFAGILFFATSSIVEDDNRQGFVLSFFIGINGFAFSLNVIYIMLAGRPNISGFLMALNTLYYFLGRLLILLGLVYIYLVARPPGFVNNIILQIGVSIGIIDLIEIIANHFLKFYFYIDENGYFTRNGMVYYLCYLGPVAVMVINSILVDRSPKEKRTKLSLTIFITVCTLFTIFQLAMPNTEVVYLGSLLSIIILYCTTQNFEYKRRAREAAELEKEIANQKILLLQSQMQPHFLFNSLLSIRRLISTDQEAAVVAMDKFVVYLRGNVDMLDAKEPIPVMQELKFVDDYLQIQQMRFGEKVDYEFIINEENFKVPALTVQPLVENAIRHGIRKRPTGAGKVTIETGMAETEYWVEVKDNGVGFDVSELGLDKGDNRSHVGLNNAKLRVEATGGRMIVHSKVDKGTTVRIYVPMEG